jgi:hydroxymethylpyrimidine/phosphomethylpyrimidine kinase
MTTPVALTIAGSDSSAGAGLQADLKTFSACQVYGLTAVTCVVAEVPGRVSAIQAVTPELVAGQVRLALAAFPVAAIKTGMLFSTAIIEAVCAALADCRAPVVVDPVMVASSGDALLEPEAVATYRDRLFPRAALVTPNLDEARVLLGRPISTVQEMREAGRELARRWGVPFLLKGGHLGGREAVDILVAGEESPQEFVAPFVEGVSTHGTGCTYSAAITAGLAHGLALSAAVAQAKRFVTGAIANHHRWTTAEGTTDALAHFPPGPADG